MGKTLFDSPSFANHEGVHSFFDEKTGLKAIVAVHSTARGPAAKLFAFGYDAWLLTGYLDKIAANANAAVPGATGTLRVDGFGNIMRSPAWSTFSNGQVIALARSDD